MVYVSILPTAGRIIDRAHGGRSDDGADGRRNCDRMGGAGRRRRETRHAQVSWQQPVSVPTNGSLYGNIKRRCCCAAAVAAAAAAAVSVTAAAAAAAAVSAATATAAAAAATTIAVRCCCAVTAAAVSVAANTNTAAAAGAACCLVFLWSSTFNVLPSSVCWSEERGNMGKKTVSENKTIQISKHKHIT